MRAKICLLSGLIALAGCRTSSTSIVSSWKDPETMRIYFQKMAAIDLNPQADIRQQVEDQLARLIPRTSATYPFVSIEQLKNPDAVRAQLQSAGYDGVVVMRLVKIDEKVTYVPTSPFNQFAGNIYNWDHMGVPVDQRTAVVETRIYSVSKEQPLWSGRSRTVNPKSIRHELPDLVLAVADRMKKDGIMLGPPSEPSDAPGK